MNKWMRDPRVEKAEEDAFCAERLERGGDRAKARERYLSAASAFARVSLAVPPELPNTRSDLAIAAVASYARGGAFEEAIDFGRRVLAEPAALTPHGREELERMVRDYAPFAVRVLRVDLNRGAAVRDDVRSLFRRAVAA